MYTFLSLEAVISITYFPYVRANSSILLREIEKIASNIISFFSKNIYMKHKYLPENSLKPLILINSLDRQDILIAKQVGLYTSEFDRNEMSKSCSN